MAARRFTAGEITRVETLVSKTRERWKSTLGEKEDVSKKLQSLVSVFQQLQTIFELDKSLQAQAAGNEDLADLLESAEATVATLYIFPDRLAAASTKPGKKLHIRHHRDSQDQLRDELKSAKDDLDDFVRAFSILLQRISEDPGESQTDQRAVEEAKVSRKSMDSKISSSRASIDSRRTNRYTSFSVSPTSHTAHPGVLVPGNDKPARVLGMSKQELDTFELHLQETQGATLSPRSGQKLRMFYGVPPGAGSDPYGIKGSGSPGSPDSQGTWNKRASSNPDDRLDRTRRISTRSGSAFQSFYSGGSDDPASETNSLNQGERSFRSSSIPSEDSDSVAELDGSGAQRSRQSSASSRPRLSRSGVFTPTNRTPPESADLTSQRATSPVRSFLETTDLDTEPKSASGGSFLETSEPNSASSASDRDSSGHKFGLTPPEAPPSLTDPSPTSLYSDESGDSYQNESVKDGKEDESETPTEKVDVASAAPQITPFHFPSPLSPISLEL